MDGVMQLAELLFVFLIPALISAWAGKSGTPAVAAVNVAVLVIALVAGNVFLFTLVNGVASGVLLCLFPSTGEAEYKKKVRRARDEFYLREQEQFEGTHNPSLR